jgi:hypothetical protein
MSDKLSLLQYCTRRAAECERVGSTVEAQYWRDYRWTRWDRLIEQAYELNLYGLPGRRAAWRELTFR